MAAETVHGILAQIQRQCFDAGAPGDLEVSSTGNRSTALPAATAPAGAVEPGTAGTWVNTIGSENGGP